MANSYFTLTLDDNSPTVAYAPFRDTFGAPNLTAGWNPYYTGSGFSSGSNSSSVVSNIGNGTSLHLTACDAAQVAIQWNGEHTCDFSHTSFACVFHACTLCECVGRLLAERSSIRRAIFTGIISHDSP